LLFESRGERLIGSGGGESFGIITEEAEGLSDARINVGAGVIGRVAREGPEGGSRLRPEGGVHPIGGLPRQEGKAKGSFTRRRRRGEVGLEEGLDPPHLRYRVEVKNHC
jgi:hypothetical protein